MFLYAAGGLFYRKALDNNDLNQVRLTSGFVKSKVCWGVLSLAGS